MDLSFLPAQIANCINRLCIDKLYQIRLRTGYPISIIYNNEYFFLSENGFSKEKQNAINCAQEYINYIIDSVTERSLYAYNEKIINGFLSLDSGVRIGIAGECVFEKNKILTIKNVSSLNIRIPHDIIGASNSFYKFVFDKGEVYNTLILSPPFCGKTTVIKDIVRKINEDTNKSILIIDERNEFFSVSGINVDIIKYCNKSFGFDYGIRSLSPNVVVSDELASEEDWLFCKKAVLSGVKIIASCHCESMRQLKRKTQFIDGIFDKYIFLKKDCFGTVDKIYDRNFNVI